MIFLDQPSKFVITDHLPRVFESLDRQPRHTSVNRVRQIIDVEGGSLQAIDELRARKLQFDLYYIKNRNIMMDLVILLRTPATGFRLRGR